MSVATIRDSETFPTIENISLACHFDPEYVRERLEKRIKDNPKMGKELDSVIKKIMPALDDYIEEQRIRRAGSSDSWLNGKRVSAYTDANIQYHLAAKAAEDLKDEQVVVVTLNYAVNDKADQDAHYVRAWTDNEGQLDANKSEKLDDVFKGWLASKDAAIKGGVVHSMPNNEKVSATELRTMMQDNSLPEYMEQYNIDVKLQERPYPSQQAAEKAKEVSAPEAPQAQL